MAQKDAAMHGLGDGLMQLTFSHMTAHFDLILRFCLAAATVEKSEGTDAGKREKAEKDRCWRDLRMVAYRICVGADAWRRLCGELKIDPDLLLGRLPGYRAMELAEEAARLYAFTPEEAAAFARKSGGEGAEIPTVEGSAQAMREFIDQRIAWWG